jgi:hypothetical protein
MLIQLRESQEEAIRKLHNGCILNGGVGSGKSRTSIAYYFKDCGGDWHNNHYTPMKYAKDLYIITTAKKRDSLEWEEELLPFLISKHPEVNFYKNKVVIDSWNNIGKYSNVSGAFFIFDEQRVVGKGTWVKAFLKIAKANKWILLSATPGDTWSDYIPVFVANGFYKNRTEFNNEHVIYSRFTNYPKIDRYVNTKRLVRLRDNILVDIEIERHTVRHDEDIFVNYDLWLTKDIMKTRTNPFNQGYIPCDPEDYMALLVGEDISVNEVTPVLKGWIYEPKNGDYVKLINAPIKSASELCYLLRQVVNSDESRQVALIEIFEKHPRMIIFYNYDYELDILKGIYYGENVEVAEWNGHKHQEIPESNSWVYLVQYNAGAEGWNCIKTDTIVFYSQNYSYKIVEQASGRIDRMNTPYTDLYYYHLKSRSAIDIAIGRALKEKKKFNERKFTKWDA